MTTSATIGASGVSYIDALLSGVKWGGGALTIHFATSSASLGYALGDNSAFAALSGLEVTAFKSILARWAEVSGLTFTEVADPAQADLSIYWYRAADNPTARAFGPGNTALAGDIQLGSGISGTDLTQAGSYSYFMALQQIAVALGLKDPGAAAAGFPEDDAMAVPESVLSSVSYEGGSSAAYTIGAGSYPAMPMLNDIAAIQHLYGVNTNALTGSIGDTTYTFDPSAAVIFRALWDGGGFDTINFASYSVGLSLDLRPGHWSNLGGQYATLDAGDAAVKPPGNIVLPYLHNGGGYRIEAAYGGSGDDLIQGNDVDNLLRGNGGNDTLRGGGGVDTLVGGAGSDAFDVSEGLAGAVQISDFVAGDRIILPFAPSGGISRSDGAALTAGQVSISFNGFYSVLNVGLDATPGYDLRIVLANSTVFDNLNLSGDTITYQADTVAPTLTAVSGPADNAVKVPLDATPTLHFSERLLPGTGSFQVYNVTDGAVVQTIAVGSGAVSGWGTEQLTLQLAALPEGKIIAIRWDAGVVTDLSGNALAAGNSGDTLYSFTTNIRPTASASAGDLNVAAAGGSSYSFTVTYSDADGTIDGATIGLDDVTVTAPDASTLTVTGFTWNAGARTATYTVAAPGGTWSAAADGVYRIGLVGGAVRDDTGDAVAAVGALAEFEVDMTPPAMPTVALAEDTGRLNNDRITSNGEIMVSGLEPGATFQFSTDSGGQWTTGGGTSFTLPAGSYGAGVVRVRQVDAAGNEGPAWNLAAVTVDATAPRVLSVERDTPTGELTNADIISFRVTFDEEVYGLASGVTLTGTTATLSGSSANGLTYVFTFSGGDLANLNGVVGLSFSGPFADAAGNALTTTVVGADQSYTLDNRAPQLSSATVQGPR
ncbi:Ig-like domain-containing protein [Phenylobacterium sp. J426]|uniref:Ig-like domain-containing protein n=1 Tax=Phenylobacterium sp. J426 TaxID=2898439 RepID=UPI0021510A9F|nr:Ig-like domain-containing protein [Phenylobacterium sp. J426]MCR5874274.1 Ig-like domain-containing protein [Phenylobacterium sp. J426]